MSLFKDRREAGRRLTRELSAYADRPEVIVLALPRGGVPVAYEVVCAITPEPFYGVSRWHQDFSQTSDDELRRFLKQAAQESNLRKEITGDRV
jgi:predicted phosphoribosyltransferase